MLTSPGNAIRTISTCLALAAALSACASAGRGTSHDTGSGGEDPGDTGASSSGDTATTTSAGSMTTLGAGGAAPMHTPTDERLLYVTTDARIASAFTDGTDEKVLSPAGWFCKTPAWSPDGKRVAFSSDQSGNPELYVMSADGSAPKSIVPWGTEDKFFDDVLGPSWSKDDVIAFEGVEKYMSPNGTDVTHEVFSVKPDGSDFGYLPLGGGGEHSAPAWSPDGKHIAVVIDGSLWIESVQNPNIGTSVAMTPAFGAIVPTWTPSSDAVVYLRSGDPEDPSSPSTIVRVSPDGTGEQTLITLPSPGGRVTIARDGKTIAVNLLGDEQATDLEVLPAAGGSLSLLLHGASDPAYQP